MAETRKFNLYENCFIIPTLLIYPEKSARQKKEKKRRKKKEKEKNQSTQLSDIQKP